MFHFLYVTRSGSSYFARTLHKIKHFFASLMKLIGVVAITSCAKTVQPPTRKTLCIFNSFWSIFEAAMHSVRSFDSWNKLLNKRKTKSLVWRFNLWTRWLLSIYISKVITNWKIMIRQIWVIWKIAEVLSKLIINFSWNLLWSKFLFLCGPPIIQKNGIIQGGGGRKIQPTRV